MDTLPGDVIAEILFHIRECLEFCSTAVNIACTCKSFSSVTRSDLIWRKALDIFFKAPNQHQGKPWRIFFLTRFNYFFLLGNCKRLFFGYVTAKPVDGLKIILHADRNTIEYGEIMNLTTILTVSLEIEL